MLQQVLDRRLRHDEWPFPDLIIVDGGKAQVNAMQVVLKEQEVNIPVIGLVKNNKHVGESIVIPDGSSQKFAVIRLDKLSPNDRNLLLAIGAEAHRFAISHYRFRHRKSLA